MRRWQQGEPEPAPTMPAWGTPTGGALVAGAAVGVAVLGLPALTGEDPTLLALRAGGAVPTLRRWRRRRRRRLRGRGLWRRVRRVTAPRALGVGIGWRRSLERVLETLPGVDFLEVVAEDLDPGHVPAGLARLRERGLPVVPHGVSLSLGGAERPDPARLAHLARCAETLGSPLVSEHLAFVRAGGLEAGHLLPVPRTREALGVVAENVRIAQAELPVPLALENVAALLSWPEDELTEAEFLAALVERTAVQLLVDVANLHTNRVNHGLDPTTVLDAVPAGFLAYVHVAGGRLIDGLWHDTHADPIAPEVLDVLDALCDRVDPPGVLLERDGAFPTASALGAELAAVRGVVDRAGAR